MTKSTITDKRVTSVIERLEHYACNLKWTNVRGAQDLLTAADGLRELQERRKATMNSEPVILYRERNPYNGLTTGWQELTENEFSFIKENAGENAEFLTLYRHAQPVPVVPEEKSIPNTLSMYAVDAVAAIAEVKGWNACRAAMLQELKKSAGTEAICRGDENVQVLHTKSPAQSDCCPAQNCIHSAQGVDRPVAWHHSAKSKEGNHGTCCFSYASSHDFGPRYEKPQSQPHYLPERLDYDRALHFLSTEPRKVTPETVIGGNSPAIPDGYVMVPKEPTEAMMLHNSGCQHHAWDDPDCAMRQTRRLIWSHMLAAAPQSPGSEPATVPGKWIPVSERMPELGDWLVTDGCDFDVQLFNGEQFIPGFVWEDKITHWMPLPAAPQEVKGE